MITANGGQSSPADTTDTPLPPSAAICDATTTETSQLSTAAAAAATSQQSGYVKTQATAIDAGVTAPPVPMDTTDEVHGLQEAVTLDDETMVVDIDEDSTIFGSAASLGTNSCVSTTTHGESSVTWATVAAHQVYDPTAMSGTVAHNQESGSVGSVDTNFMTSLTKLQSKSKKKQEKETRQLSSLAAAAAAGAVILRPQNSVLATAVAQEKEKPKESAIVVAATAASSQDTSLQVMQQLAKLQDENALLMQMVLRLQRENDEAKNKEKERATVYSVASEAIAGQSSLARMMQAQSQLVSQQALPTERIEVAASRAPAGERQLTVFQTPPRRKSKKTPHEYEFVEIQRTPPRTPEGQPQTAKKTRRMDLPHANRFAPLGEDEAEEEDDTMEDADADSCGSIEADNAAPSVAEVNKKLAAVNIRTHHLGPDSYMNKGAGLHK